MFTLKMGTVMESSKLPYRVWAIGIYLFATSLKGVSSMKLHRELGITQKAAWCMLHRLRKTKASGAGWFSGPVEVDETHMGGKRASMSNAKRRELADEGASRGAAGKVAVVGAQDRATKQVRAQVVENTDKPTLQSFVIDSTVPDATVCTDEAAACEGLPMAHAAVKHSVKEFVRGQPGTGAHQQHGVLPVAVQARVCRRLPQDVAQAPRPLRHRVPGTPQRPRIRHHRPDGRGR